MTRDELVDKIREANLPEFVMSGAAAETILELVENELALSDIKPPWAPGPWRWAPGGEDFDKAYKALSDRRLNPEQRDALVHLTGASWSSGCKHCSRPGLRLVEDRERDYALCWYHHNNEPG